MNDRRVLVAGLFCLWPAPFDWLVQKSCALVSRGAAPRRTAPVLGEAGALLVGVSLGLAWAPCASPILASVLALAASSQAPGRAVVLLGAYAAGAGLPMLAIAYGGDWVSSRLGFFNRRAELFRKLFGAIAIAFALLQLLQYDVLFTAWATQWLPSISTGL